MKKVTPNAVERIKTVFLLGLSSNLTTVAGLILVWVLLARNEWVSGFFETLFMVLAFAPIFMADAINHYCLGRIKLEYFKGWDDVQVTHQGRKLVAIHHQLFRITSIVPAYFLAGSILAQLSSMSVDMKLNLRMAFLAAFILHFFRATWFLNKCIAPRLPGYGGHRLFLRTIISAVAFYLWYVYFLSNIAGNDVKTEFITASAIFANGMFYFLLNAFMHPLPTRFSLLRPGKAIRKEAFFSVEIIDEDQLKSLHNGQDILETARRIETNTEFVQNKNLRLPLLELPLFQAWGTILSSQDGKTIMMILDSEVKRGVHRSLISIADSGLTFVSTDFNAPKAKFPEFLKYKTYPKNIADVELLKDHMNSIEGHQLLNLENIFAGKIEAIIKEMIRFLETSSGTKGGTQIKAATHIAEEEKEDEIKP
jgi:hypothetical protein